MGDSISDDRTMIVERTFQLLAKLHPDFKSRMRLTDDFNAQLWDSFDHSRMIYVGDQYDFLQCAVWLTPNLNSCQLIEYHAPRA